MDKDFSRKKLSVSRTAKSRWRLLVLILILVGGVGIFFLSSILHGPAFLASFYSQARVWLVERKANLQHGLAKKIEKPKTPLVSKHDAEPPIHFEFYSALPNMQVSVPSMAVENDSPSQPVINKTANDIAKSYAATPTLASISNADELAQEVSTHIKQITYFVQLGLFRNKALAEHYRKTFSHEGLGAIKTSAVDKNFYRVQLGPFITKEQAKQIQQQLRKKGINAIVRSEVQA